MQSPAALKEGGGICAVQRQERIDAVRWDLFSLHSIAYFQECFQEWHPPSTKGKHLLSWLGQALVQAASQPRDSEPLPVTSAYHLLFASICETFIHLQSAPPGLPLWAASSCLNPRMEQEWIKKNLCFLYTKVQCSFSMSFLTSLFNC